MRSYQSPDANVYFKVPTNSFSSAADIISAGGSKSTSDYGQFIFRFDDTRLQVRLNRFMAQKGYNSVPKEFTDAILGQLNQLKLSLLRHAGESIVKAIHSGGFLASIVGYSNKQAIYTFVGNRAGNRMFAMRSGQLASSIQYDVGIKPGKRAGTTEAKLSIKWGPAMSTPKVPGPYQAPYDQAAAVPFNGTPPLEQARKAGIPVAETNKVAAIESGSPYQDQTIPGMKGFFGPEASGFRAFEGAAYKNTVALQKAYERAINDIFTKGSIQYNGRNLTLDKFVDQFMADQVKEAVNSLKISGKVDDSIALKANESAFLKQLKRIFPSNSLFVKGLTPGIVRKLFEAFRPGKSKQLSKRNIGLGSNDAVDDFTSILRLSINDFLNGG